MEMAKLLTLKVYPITVSVHIHVFNPLSTK